MELKLISQAYRYAAESFYMDVSWRKNEGDKFPRAAALLNSARFVGSVAVCAVIGHKWQDTGYAGPESGCIDIGCARCGWDRGRTVLY